MHTLALIVIAADYCIATIIFRRLRNKALVQKDVYHV